MMTVLVVGALALLVLAGLLHARRTRRSVYVVRRRLGAVEPADRLAALDLIERDGVALHAGALYKAALAEQHPAVIDAMATVVRRALWEPGQSPEVIALRRWATRIPAEAIDPGRLGEAVGADEPDLVTSLEAMLGERLVQFRMRGGDVVVEPVRPVAAVAVTDEELPVMHSPIWWLSQRGRR